MFPLSFGKGYDVVHPELAAEQEHVDRAYARLEELQEAAQALSSGDLIVRASGPAARVDRDVREATGARRLRELRLGSLNLCFGRIDRSDGQAFHVGRLGVSDAEQEPLVIDWRAPVAEAFYRATPIEPMGLRRRRRRHLLTRGRVVLGIDDEAFLGGRPAGADDLVLVGEGALLESLARARTGRMSDIVGTIQAEQDRIVRAPLAGAVVVQGGPGTGKTAVALHRAAYLLFTHRFPLEEQGVLVIGPNPVFLRYIERVLPSLGESGCKLATPAELVDMIAVSAPDAAEARRVKGDGRMAAVLASGVRCRERPLVRAVDIAFGAYRLRVGRKGSAAIVDVGRARGLPHNAARLAVEQALLGYLHRRYEVAHARTIEAGLTSTGRRSRADVFSELRRSRGVGIVLERIWPELTPEQLVHDLLSRPPLLAEAAGDLLSDDERHAILRDTNAQGWSATDLPLLDEAARLLGRRPAAQRRASAPDPDAEAMVERMLDDMHESGVLFEGDPSMTRDVRNHLRAKERSGGSAEVADLRTYGHVVVDEAQDLAPMEWRMIARRCPSGSMTVVGDLGQASGWWNAVSWTDVLAEVTPRRPEVVELSVNYRTPSEVMSLAAGVLAAYRPELRAARSVRSSGRQPVFVRVDGGALVGQVVSVAAGQVEAVGAGKVAVIAPSHLRAVLQAAVDADPSMGRPNAEILEAPVTVLVLDEAKGLEFDSVVVVEPGEIVAEHPNGLGALYVALTRTTDRLVVVHAGPLPPSLG